jgi:hypothetical protein
MSTTSALNRIRESQAGFRARCLVCRDSPSRWRLEIRFRIYEYFCEQHEANKDMRLAASLELPDQLCC